MQSKKLRKSPPKTWKSQKKRGGRPTRLVASLKAAAELAVDPDSINPRAILAGIAVDRSQPATARVAACRALLLAAGTSGDQDRTGPGADELSKRAIELMQIRGRAN